MRPRRVGDPVAQRRGPLLIGLDGDPETAPAVREQRVIGKQRLEHVELELEPVGFFGVDGQMDVGLRRLERELAHDRHHRRHGFGRDGYIRSAGKARSA